MREYAELVKRMNRESPRKACPHNADAITMLRCERGDCACDGDERGQAAAAIKELQEALNDTREELAGAYIKLSGTVHHRSDCATSNAPALHPEPCNCAFLDKLKSVQETR